MEYTKQILQDLLTMIYQYAGVSIICSVLFIIVWEQSQNSSWKIVLNNFIKQLKDNIWQKRLVTVIYIFFVFQRTIFNRSPWGNPLENVIGNWWFIKNEAPNYEIFENILLFLPLFPLIKLSEIDKKINHFHSMNWFGIILIPLECSVGIEITQLIFRVGTFQISDIFYNMLGGLLGGLFYYIVHNLRKSRNKGN